jgi:hypothetical protein
MNPLNRLAAIHYMIGEAKFCLEYSRTAPLEDKKKFRDLGIRVLQNMSRLLIEIHTELEAGKAD